VHHRTGVACSEWKCSIPTRIHLYLSRQTFRTLPEIETSITVLHSARLKFQPGIFQPVAPVCLFMIVFQKSLHLRAIFFFLKRLAFAILAKLILNRYCK